MTTNSFETRERVLIGALAVVLALGVTSIFLGIVRGSSVTTAPTTTIGAVSSGTEGPGVRATTSTRLPTSTTVVAVTADSDTPWTEGPCSRISRAADSSTIALRVYFNCGSSNAYSSENYVERTVATTTQHLGATLGELVKGPTQSEIEVGFGSYFSANTADAFRGVNIDNGLATIDFNRFVTDPTMNTDVKRQSFTYNIAANALQFDTVTSVELQLEGNCAAFSAHIGGTGCTTITKADLNITTGGDS